MYSETLKQMIQDGVGFRNECYSGSKERVLKDVVAFEIKELGNLDIPDTMEYFYKDFSCGKDIVDLESALDLEDDELDIIIENIVSYVSKKLQKSSDDIKVLWLTTKKSVSTTYYTDDMEIDEYKIVGLPISDIDSDGALFAF